MTKRITLTFAIGLAIAMLVLPASASADVLNFNLLNPTALAGLPSVVSFTATVSAPFTNTGDIFLNSDSTTIDFPLTLDDSGFFSFPLSLAPGDSFTGQLFTVTVPSFAVLYQTYNGFFEIDGGADSSTFDPIATANFTVTPVPEPATGWLLMAGLACATVPSIRRRRSALRR